MSGKKLLGWTGTGRNSLIRVVAHKRTLREVGEILRVCLTWLGNNGVKISGIFYTEANKKKIIELRDSLLKTNPIRDEEDPHVVAGVVKLFLEELSEPLLTDKLYYNWIRAISFQNEGLIKECFSYLKEDNQDILIRLLKILKQMSVNNKVTKVSSNFLGSIFAPLVLRPPPSEVPMAVKLFTILIEMNDRLQEVTEPPGIVIFQTVLIPPQLSILSYAVEIIDYVFKYFLPKELAIVSQVCHLWNRIGHTAKLAASHRFLISMRDEVGNLLNDQKVLLPKPAKSKSAATSPSKPLKSYLRETQILESYEKLETSVKICGEHLGNIVSEIAQSNLELIQNRQRIDEQYKENNPFTKKLNKIHFFTIQAINHFKELCNFRHQLSMFRNTPDSESELFFLNAIKQYYESISKKKINLDQQENNISLFFNASVLIFESVIKISSRKSLETLAKYVSQRLVAFLKSQKDPNLVLNDAAIINILTDTKSVRQFKKSLEISNKKIKLADLLNDNNVEHTISSQYMIIRLKESSCQKTIAHINSITAKMIQCHLLLTKKFDRINYLQKEYSGPFNSSRFKVKKKDLEEYSTTFHNDNSIGSFVNFIKKKNNITEGEVNVDCSNLDLTGMNLRSTDLSGCIFDGANLTFASLYGCNLSNASFIGATLTSCQLQKAIIIGTNFEKSVGLDENIYKEIQLNELGQVINSSINYLMNQYNGFYKLIKSCINECTKQEYAAILPKLALTYGDNFPFDHPLNPDNFKEELEYKSGIPVLNMKSKIIKTYTHQLFEFCKIFDLWGMLIETINNLLQKIDEKLKLGAGEEIEELTKWKKDLIIELLKVDGQRFLKELQSKDYNSNETYMISLIQKFIKDYSQTRSLLTDPLPDDLVILDLTEGINFSKIDFSSLNVSGIKFTADVLLRAKSVNAAIGINPDILYRVKKCKYEACKTMLQNGERTILDCISYIEGRLYLDLFVNPASEEDLIQKLNSLTTEALRVSAFYLLSSFKINTLKDSSPYSLNTLTEKGLSYQELDGEEAKKMIIELMKHRNFFLNRALLLSIYLEKLDKIYSEIGDVSLTLFDYETLQIDLLPEDIIEIEPLADKVKKMRKYHLTLQDEKSFEAERQLISALLDDINAPPDPFVEDDPSQPVQVTRLWDAIMIASDKEKRHILDLRNYSNEVTKHLASIDFAPDTQIMLSQKQLYTSLSTAQQQARIEMFQKVVQSGNIDHVRKWIQLGVAINASAEDGRTPLMDACFQAHVEIARLLLEHQANVQPPTYNDFSLIEGLCRTAPEPEPPEATIRHKEIVALLLQHGAELDLHSAVAMGDLKKVKEKIKLSNDPQLVNSLCHGETPLHLATRYGRQEIVAFLCKKGAIPSIQDKNGQTAIELAVNSNHIRILELFPDIRSYKDKDNNSLLFIVAQKGFNQLAASLIQKGIPIDIPTAVLLEKIDLIEKECKSNYNQVVASQQRTLIHIAVEFNKKKVIEFLLSNHVDIDVTMDGKATPLMMACKKGHDEVVQMLLKYKNNLVSHPSHNAFPPLYLAVTCGHKSVVRTLLEDFKADPGVSYDNLGRPCLHESLRKKHIGIAKMLLAAGANPLALDIQGNIPLHLAILMGKLDMVNLIIKAMTNMKNKSGLTPLDLVPATSIDREEIYKQFN